ncbi:hypothetical protein EZV62_012496 [Acer yangbiense]|uniref:Uncharacterized protein n=1 Tax=Acer yangbiense TaxID=1000413 RepID=A0A5C7HVK0_9ROSI|nr:hypothetical protein EZV62_012496 [Acer yangbiense]
MIFSFYMCRYLPPYTSFLPTRYRENDDEKKKKTFWENVIFSQLSYLITFIILVCITERHKLKQDPLNFNVLNITIEIIRIKIFNIKGGKAWKLS